MARKIPTQEQIEKVDEIAKTLGIDFPQSSKDFTFKKYKRFIFLHQQDYEAWRKNVTREKQIIERVQS